MEERLVAERREGPGIAAVSDPPTTLMATLGDWSPARVALCGMAGARNGLREAPYLPCPAAAADWGAKAIEFDLAGSTVAIAPGLADHARADVMRGEETQVFGAIAQNRALQLGEHLLVLPGTHSKWVRLADARIVSFRTFITGELFGLLERSSLLAAGGSAPDADMEEGFSDGLARRAERAELSSMLFEARGAQLLAGKSTGWASGFISSVLIGAEIDEMKPEVAPSIIAEPALAARYARALEHYRLAATILDAENCTIAGLSLLDAGS